MDGYRRGWALRYLREAKAELEAARKMPYMAPSLVLEAIRKARNAIYHSLGEPALVESLVRELAKEVQNQTKNDPVLKFLVETEMIFQKLAQVEEADSERVLRQAGDLVELASNIVETLTEEKMED